MQNDASPIQSLSSPTPPTNLSDQAIGNNGDNDVTILLGNGDGTFTSTASYVVVRDAPSSVAVRLFNADLNLDLAI